MCKSLNRIQKYIARKSEIMKEKQADIVTSRSILLVAWSLSRKAALLLENAIVSKVPLLAGLQLLVLPGAS